MTRRSVRSLWWLAAGLLCLLASGTLVLAPSLVPERREVLLAALASLGMIAVHVAWRVLR